MPLLHLTSPQGWYFGAFDRFAREWRWRRRTIGGGPFQTPALSGDSIWTGALNAVVYKIRPSDGTSIWESPYRGSILDVVLCPRTVISQSLELRWHDRATGRLIAARLPDDGGAVDAMSVIDDSIVVITTYGGLMAYPCTP